MPRYDTDTIAAIHEALDDEYRARATYAAVIERFGAVRPFVNIIAAEDRHARALERLLAKDGRAIPSDRWAGTVTAPESLAQAFALGVQAEIDNRDMYDRLERMTADPEVLRVFGNLRAASQENHLPAFQRHLDRSQGSSSDMPSQGGNGWRGGAFRGTESASPLAAAGHRGGGFGKGHGGGKGHGHRHGPQG